MNATVVNGTARAVEIQSSPISSKFITTATYDTIFFLASPIAGYIYFLFIFIFPEQQFLFTLLWWIGFLQTHFASTWSFYLDQHNREYYRQHKLRYYVIPVVIMIVVVLSSLFNYGLLTLLTGGFGTYHRLRQSVGILQMYRFKNKEIDPDDKQAEAYAIWLMNSYFLLYGLLNVYDFSFVRAKIGRISVDDFSDFLLKFLLLIAILSVINVIFRNIRHWNSTQDVSLPKIVFLTTSILCFFPYLWIRDWQVGMLTCATAHYMQYLGIIWHMNRNKYTDTSPHDASSYLLKSISQHVFPLILTLLAYGAIQATLMWFMPAWVGHGYLWIGLVYGLWHIHFYLDGLMWRFRNPFVRKTVLPYIGAYMGA